MPHGIQPPLFCEEMDSGSLPNYFNVLTAVGVQLAKHSSTFFSL